MSTANRWRVGDVHVSIADNYVATMEIRRGPNNFFNQELIESLVAVVATADAEPRVRAIVLCSEGKHFCAGADFTSRDSEGAGQLAAGPVRNPGGAPRHLYDAAVDLFATRTPVIAAVQGAAIGGGLGLACFADFRIANPEARFAANFARLGFHHGFGLTETLPRLVGQQRSLELLYTGRRIGGQEALAIGLVDQLVAGNELRRTAAELAGEIAASAPLAVDAIRQTMRGDLAQRVRSATDREKFHQDWLRQTSDWGEGVQAMTERRVPNFEGK